MNTSQTCYALYRGDVFVDLGTDVYLAGLIGCSLRTFHSYSTPRHFRIRPKGFLVIKVDK